MFDLATTDFIDVHTHERQSANDVFAVDSIIAGQNRKPVAKAKTVYSTGAHPWFLTEDNKNKLIDEVWRVSVENNVVAIGETGFDRRKGASLSLQRESFEEHVRIAEELDKPLVIHCVRGWADLLGSHKRLKPKVPWIIHGFRGNYKLAEQLMDKGMFLSIWYSWAASPFSGDFLLRHLPLERLFLETDGADVDIAAIYLKVADDYGISIEELKAGIYNNFMRCFKLNN